LKLRKKLIERELFSVVFGAILKLVYGELESVL